MVQLLRGSPTLNKVGSDELISPSDLSFRFYKAKVKTAIVPDVPGLYLEFVNADEDGTYTPEQLEAIRARAALTRPASLNNPSPVVRSYTHVPPANRLKKKVAYSGIMLDSPVSLRNWWIKNVGPVEENVYCHHMTLQVSPSVADLASLPLGKRVSITIYGYHNRDGLQVVAGFPSRDVTSDKEVPHITVATATGVEPKQANNLSVEDFYATEPYVVTGRVGFMYNKGIHFDFSALS